MALSPDILIYYNRSRLVKQEDRGLHQCTRVSASFGGARGGRAALYIYKEMEENGMAGGYHWERRRYCHS